MNSLVLLIPEIFLTITAFGVMLGEAFFPARRKLWLNLAGLSLKAVAVYIIAFFINKSMPFAESCGVMPVLSNGLSIQYEPILGMVIVDSQAMFFKLAAVLTTLIVFGLSSDYREFKDILTGTYSSLLLFCTIGMMFLVSSMDFLIAVVALELLSISSFVLTGFVLTRRSSLEGAIKFFLVGTFSTGILLFGVSYYYGYFGTTNFTPLLNFSASGLTPDFALSFILVFLVAGLGFKLAMAPFHMWAPDAYEAAPTPITAFLSVGPKVATLGLIMRIFIAHDALNLTGVLAVLAAITMFVGNIGALKQNNVKRLLAYSSIAQVGYILVAFVAGGQYGREATLIYTFVYLFMNLGVFSILIAISNEAQSDDITAFAGLSKRSFSLAFVLFIFLLSMAGIPPLAGFIGKFSIFAAIINKPDLLWLGVLAVLNSVISLFYYFRISKQAFFNEGAQDSGRLAPSAVLVSCLVLTLGVTVVAGLFPDCVLGWVRSVVG